MTRRWLVAILDRVAHAAAEALARRVEPDVDLGGWDE